MSLNGGGRISHGSYSIICADKGQIRDDYLNVLSSKPEKNLVLVEPSDIEIKGRKGKGRLKHHEVNDGFYHDRDNDILNSGQAFRFTNLRYHPFLDSSLGISISIPPRRPIMDTSEADYLLSIPIRIMSDRCPPRRDKYRNTTIQAGQTVFFKAISPEDKDKEKRSHI
ncbi:hypothetical protein ASPVEDRAFT_26611 [Aspergillus versicolor CBS 583.65]|uniref:Uncharacterized protein n=1 Tax=Aspergillus versicolor CBS 583.65 TaxID=1036611 RepID=A0A1L9PE87_ASPVE|nr:uncharacterized protein ASPVEDRAFT_26611 [Aspergillus versicolor CBS 583.65]OJI99843.1 hypothetical protein ASPVEDRAFT_26611 [Aspergillus versicolor CBS 583.65]